MPERTESELRTRLAELDQMIDEATGWGAWLGAAVEERDGIARRFGLPPRRIVGGTPLAD